jgi:hypothetical protein
MNFDKKVGVAFENQGVGKMRKFLDEDGQTVPYTMEEYEMKLGGVAKENMIKDQKLMKTFKNRESAELNRAIEQSSDPKKGKEIKKVLNAMTIGAVMLTSTLGSLNVTKAEDNFVTQREISTTQISKNQSELGDKHSYASIRELSIDDKAKAVESMEEKLILRSKCEENFMENIGECINFMHFTVAIEEYKDIAIKFEDFEEVVKDLEKYFESADIKDATQFYAKHRQEIDDLYEFRKKRLDSLIKKYDPNGSMLQNIQLATLNKMLKDVETNQYEMSDIFEDASREVIDQYEEVLFELEYVEIELNRIKRNLEDKITQSATSNQSFKLTNKQKMAIREKIKKQLSDANAKFDVTSFRDISEDKDVQKYKEKLISRINTEEYLNRLIDSYDGDINKALKMQQERLLRVEMMPIFAMDDKKLAGLYIPEYGLILSNTKQRKTILHELSHSATDGNEMLLPDDIDTIKQNTVSKEEFIKKISEDNWLNKGHSSLRQSLMNYYQKTIKERGSIQGEFYFDDPTEVIARRDVLDLELVELGVKKNGEDITDDMKDKIDELGKRGYLSQDSFEFWMLMKDWESFKNVFNTVADVKQYDTNYFLTNDIKDNNQAIG